MNYRDKERRDEIQAQKDKIFTEKDMDLMQQMQSQQNGLQKLIQEFRVSNADKLLEENQQLQDRLERLEVEDRSLHDNEHMNMPVESRQNRKKNQTIVPAARSNKVKKDKDFWKSHKPQYASVTQIQYDPYYNAKMMQSYNQGGGRYPEYVDSQEYEPTNDVYFDTKYNDRKPSMMFPTVLDDDMVMTRKGVFPRTARKSGLIKSYNGPVGHFVD
jgi:hypothetical protein